jgi:hypothetical protein
MILDQFEEILMDPTNWAAKEEFFAQVGVALRDRRCWALLAMREDYLAGLDPYLRLIPTRLSTTYRLGLLNKSAALNAIERPASVAGAKFACFRTAPPTSCGVRSPELARGFGPESRRRLFLPSEVLLPPSVHFTFRPCYAKI